MARKTNFDAGILTQPYLDKKHSTFLTQQFKNVRHTSSRRSKVPLPLFDPRPPDYIRIDHAKTRLRVGQTHIFNISFTFFNTQQARSSRRDSEALLLLQIGITIKKIYRILVKRFYIQNKYRKITKICSNLVLSHECNVY